MESYEVNRGMIRWVLLVVASCLVVGVNLQATGEDPDGDVPVIHVAISDDPTRANIEIFKEEKIILTETPEEAENVDHTVTLQDFEQGFQAVKDLDRGKCFILPTKGAFESIESIAEGKGSPRSREEPAIVYMNAVRCPIPPELLGLAVGEKIASFCEGLDSHWLVDTTDTVGGPIRHKRASASPEDVIIIIIRK